ncbi:hypothetical protein [Draconibacterium halophilum]|uniref:Uncharacterized protein n=1 Tax=Draconibacterium halophilum TaxID=2706887 RepID=A0A6C0RFK4_9BACT|nr:hypothetical protein [Draconibacterium halophilum]QIA07851.1 hypothetical protein G0Q07_08970 [Draconibacterium halophilum]
MKDYERTEKTPKGRKDSSGVMNQNFSKVSETLEKLLQQQTFRSFTNPKAFQAQKKETEKQHKVLKTKKQTEPTVRFCYKPPGNVANHREMPLNHPEMVENQAELEQTKQKCNKPVRSGKNRPEMQHYHVVSHFCSVFSISGRNFLKKQDSL